ncbi:hypothetical protein BD324DRAFT_636510 [Kockovaella imperatae]|uniref:Uncharacterized protein n=1 Tax=Kockovaella imperatae TaxID=4999 RepID=A0A1Y1U975_9TREE|nr:hypothetical protein BD324DRAFT_636510 [Kockovaella imperatae]ORX34580.1 hypothetical protein BD324DRAFT_636510 [Kockovaella imperatae]
MPPSQCVSLEQPGILITHFGENVKTSGGVPWDTLRRISLSQMKCPKKHMGRMLCCRVITKPCIGSALAW